MEQLEIEVKFFTPTPQSLRRTILKTGGVSKGSVFEANTLYDRNGELGRRLSVLRLRRDKKNLLTFKEPVPGTDQQFKIVRELEVEVSDLDKMGQILECLGFSAIRKYEKHRETFLLNKTKLLLDETPIGAFLELEGRKRDIPELAAALGLDWEKRIVLNYMQMFEIVKKGEDLEFSDLVFDLFEGLDLDPEKYAPLFEAGGDK